MVEPIQKKLRPKSEKRTGVLSPLTTKSLTEKAAIREALVRLRAHPLVSWVKFERRNASGAFQIRFVNGIAEYWNLSSDIGKAHDNSFIVDGRQLFNGYTIPTYNEFETNPLNDSNHESCFLIQIKDLRRAGFCEERLKIHELINKLVTEGWHKLNYPMSALRKDLAAVKSASIRTYWEARHRLTIYKRKKRPPPGRLILAHFNPIGEYRYGNRPTLIEAWQPIPLYRAINYAIQKGVNLTRASLVRIMTAIPRGFVIAGPRVPNVIVWRAIFEKLALTSVVDLLPNFGEKAVAAAANGLAYSIHGNHSLGELLSFLGLKTSAPQCTIVTATTPLADVDLDNAIKAAPTSKILAVISPAQAARIMPATRFEIRTEPPAVDKTINTLGYFNRS